MFVLMSRTSLSRRPIDSLNYGLFLRRPKQLQTQFVCLCSDPHTKGHKHHNALKKTACQTLNCSDVKTNVQRLGIMQLRCFGCPIIFMHDCSFDQDIGFVLFYLIQKSRRILFCFHHQSSGSIIFNIIELLIVKPLPYVSPPSLITHKVVGHKVVAEKKGRLEKV